MFNRIQACLSILDAGMLCPVPVLLKDWMLPSTQTDVFDQMTAPLEHKCHGCKVGCASEPRC